MGLEEIVVKGPVDPNTAKVSISGVETGAVLLGDEVEGPLGEPTLFSDEKLSNRSNMEAGESWLDGLPTDELGSRLGPASADPP